MNKEDRYIPVTRVGREPEFQRHGKSAALSTIYRLNNRGKVNRNGRRVFLKFTFLPSGTFVLRSDIDRFIEELNEPKGYAWKPNLAPINSREEQRAPTHNLESAARYLDACGI